MAPCSTTATPHRIHRPLIPMAAVLAMGIAAGARWPGHTEWAAAAVALTAAILLLGVRLGRWMISVPLVFGICLGYLSIQPWLGIALPDDHVSRYIDQGRWQIHGRVADRPTVDGDRWQFTLAAQRLRKNRKRHPVSGRIRVTGRGQWPAPKMGDSVVFRGRMRSIRNFSNPGGFDYERFMKFKHIRTRVYAAAGSLKVTEASPQTACGQRVAQIRERLGRQMEIALGASHPHTVGLLKAMLLGDRTQISMDLRNMFNRAGVGHVLAISGLHVGMVAAAAFTAAGWVLAGLPFVLRRGWVRKGASAVGLVAVVIYGMLAGLSPSTQRAMIMAAVFLAGFWVGRRHDWMNTLALAALVILLIYPPALLSISFQLSFSAVLAILAGAARFKNVGRARASCRWQGLVRRLGAFAGVSVMAILGTLPLVALYFNQISLAGPAVNLVVVPLVGLAVVPAGLLGTLFAGFWTDFAVCCWQAAAWGTDVIRWTVALTAQWPWAAVHTVTPSGLEIGLYYMSGALLMLWKRVPLRKPLLVLVLTLWVVDAGYWVHQRFGGHILRMTVLDVGQGSANLLELPGGYTVLVDGGGFSDNRRFDVGARIVAPLLWRKKIRTVDLVILTHANSDHLNGLLFVLEHFRVGEVWSNQEPAGTGGYARWRRLLAARRVRHEDFERMSRQVMRNGVRLEVLAPVAGFLERRNLEPWRDLNNNSLVLRVCYGDIALLLAGDIMQPAEAELVERLGAPGLASTVLLVPHHGSRSSCTQAFLEAVKPEEAVISAGWGNRFNFPHQEVMQRLTDSGSRIWSTARCGAVEIITDGIRYRIGGQVR